MAGTDVPRAFPGISPGYAWAFGYVAAASVTGSRWWLAGAAAVLAAAWLRARAATAEEAVRAVIRSGWARVISDGMLSRSPTPDQRDFLIQLWSQRRSGAGAEIH